MLRSDPASGERPMTWQTWWGIARRQMAYKELLTERIAEWTEERIAECTDTRILEGVVKLTDRVERHKARMGRHEKRMESLSDRRERLSLH
jgi:hypothetical protein